MVGRGAWLVMASCLSFSLLLVYVTFLYKLIISEILILTKTCLGII